MKSPHLPTATGLALAAALWSQGPLAGPGSAPGRLLVRAAPGLDDAKVEQLLDKVGGKVVRKLRGLDVRVVRVPEGKEAQLANALSRNPHFAFAEPDLLVEANAIVNDPGFANQWHLTTMGAPTAWQHTSGKGVTVAVCDTGVQADHPDLAGQVITGWNTVSNNSDTSDINGHGTPVAGTIAAAANNLAGGASVAPAARIMAMRVTQDDNTGYAYFSDLAECVTWAADHGARVANLSFGAAGSSTVASAGSYMMNKGGLVVVAAGNDGKDLGYSNSPYLVVTGSTDKYDVRASTSNFGNYVDIAAPGVSIYTTRLGGTYFYASGTSFSTPNTAATIALVMAANPALSPNDVLSIITNTAKDLGAAGWDPYFGFGRVDAGAAVAMAATVQPSDRTAPSAVVATPGAGATVKDVVTVDVKATDDFGVMSVDLLADGVLVATDTQEDPALPDVFRFAWDSKKVPDGTHTLTARAKDAAGNVGSAQAVSVAVKNSLDTTPPVVTALNPASGTTVSGTATLSATASDNVGIASLVVSAPGVQCSSATTSVTCSWNLKNVASGWYTVTATATDTAGYSSTKTASVYVQATTTTTTTKVRPPTARVK